MDEKPEISVVIPVFQAAATLPELANRLTSVLYDLGVSFEIVMVEDGSQDTSWLEILTLSQKMPQLKALKLSRNFGQHNAITAGLIASKGNWVVVMDCDLQDPPEQLPTLYKMAIADSFDLVRVKRENKKDAWMSKLLAQGFYRLFSYLAGTKIDPKIGNFGIYSRKVINSIVDMKESTRAFPMMVNWVGFYSASLPVQHAKRKHGKSTYNLDKKVDLALDILMAYSNKPLKLAMQVGLGISLIAILVALFYFGLYISGYIGVPGFASLIISQWLLGGIILFFLGVIGLYLGKTFEEARHRPTFLIDKKVGFETHRSKHSQQ